MGSESFAYDEDMRYLLYLVAAGGIFWLGEDQVDLVREAVMACQPSIEVPHPSYASVPGAARAVYLLGYLVAASAIALSWSAYLIHHGKADV